MSSFNPELQLNPQLRKELKDFFSELKGFKFVVTLLLDVTKIRNNDVTKYNTFYSNSKVETIINESNIDDAFESIYSTIISNIQISLGKGLGLNYRISHQSYYCFSVHPVTL